MYQHPALLETLMRERVAELRHAGGASGHIRREKRHPELIASARHATGWLLIDMGLRLATSRGSATHPVARTQR